LIVEDDVLLRLTIADSLRHAGFDVYEAADASEAVTVLDNVRVDALFSDINLPGSMNGVALARWVRQRQLDTKVILTSGAKQPADEAEGGARFLAKPYADTEVQQLLRKVLAH
jgi:CheY-like chemotaxis protein